MLRMYLVNYYGVDVVVVKAPESQNDRWKVLFPEESTETWKSRNLHINIHIYPHCEDYKQDITPTTNYELLEITIPTADDVELISNIDADEEFQKNNVSIYLHKDSGMKIISLFD